VQDETGGPNIAMLVVDGSGAVVAYRKLWLGAHEAVRFVPGDKPAAIDVDGWRLGLAICKDTGIAQHAADTAALGIDVYVAGVLEHQEDRSIPAERAQRIAAEHHVPVVIASFAGPTGDGYDQSAGHSSIWTADGTLLDQANSEPGGIVRAILNPPAEPVRG
jgi:predicted amidohydrolase